MKELMDKRIEKICKKKKLMGANVVLFNREEIVSNIIMVMPTKNRE